MVAIDRLFEPAIEDGRREIGARERLTARAQDPKQYSAPRVRMKMRPPAMAGVA